MIKSDNWFFDYGMSMFEPYIPEQVNPASYDLRLDNKFIDLHTGLEFTANEITLHPPKLKYDERTGLYSFVDGSAILASTLEYVKIPDDLRGVLYLKSTMARLGLDHALAGYVDPGFEGNLTLEIHAHREVTLKFGQRIVQIEIAELDQTASKPYSGRYKGQTGPTKAK